MIKFADFLRYGTLRFGKLGRIRKLYPTEFLRHHPQEQTPSPPLRGHPLSDPFIFFAKSEVCSPIFIIATKTSSTFSYIMTSDLFINLKAPNGREYKQPIGLFINNEFVKSKSGEKIISINPT